MIMYEYINILILNLVTCDTLSLIRLPRQKRRLMSLYALPDASNSLELGARKNAGSKDTSTPLTLVNFPLALRLGLKFNASNNCGNKIAHIFFSILNGTFPFLLFASATGNLYIGVVFGVLGSLSCMGSLLLPNLLSSPPALAVLHNVAEEVANVIKATVSSEIIFFFGILFPIIFTFLITPNIVNTQMFGVNSYEISVGLSVSACIGMVGISFTGALHMVFEKVQLEWCSRIDAYLKKVREQVLKVADKANMEEIVTNLAAMQEEQEAWAREMNRLFSRSTGATLILDLIWSFLPLAMIAVPSSEDTRVAQVVTLGAFASFFQIIFAVSLNGVTKVNMAWERGTSTLMNDARIQLLRLNNIGVNGAFSRWLAAHELSAARAGGVKVTLKFLRSGLGAIGSVFILVAYFVLRESLSSMLA